MCVEIPHEPTTLARAAVERPKYKPLGLREGPDVDILRLLSGETIAISDYGHGDVVYHPMIEKKTSHAFWKDIRAKISAFNRALQRAHNAVKAAGKHPASKYLQFYQWRRADGGSRFQKRSGFVDLSQCQPGEWFYWPYVICKDAKLDRVCQPGYRTGDYEVRYLRLVEGPWPEDDYLILLAYNTVPGRNGAVKPLPGEVRKNGDLAWIRVRVTDLQDWSRTRPKP